MACTIFLVKIAILALTLVRTNTASNILLIMPAGTKSHTIFYNGIIQALAEKGHEVTMISPYKYQFKTKNIRTIQLSTNYAENFLSNTFEVTIYNITKGFMYEAPKGCIKTILEEKVQAVLSEPFDLILQPFTFADCYLSTIYKKNIPFVFVFPNTIVGAYSEMVGNIDLPSIVPNMILEVAHPMTFLQRMASAMLSVVTSVSTTYSITACMEAECRRSGVCPDEMPSFSVMQRRASLAIINNVRPLEQPARPYSPTVIFAGGIHINKPKALPKELEDWIEGSGDDGFILFSLGSVVDTSQMKESVRRTILDVFGALKQRVIWKWNSLEMEDLPSNVKISPWIPQQDILAHPKIRLFITHGGLLSTQEATYFGVPVIGMPVFGDQYSNIAQVTAEGWGRKIDLQNITGEEFHRTIIEVLRNDSLRQIVEHRSRLMKDLPKSPAEEVVYWLEYVLRHDGARHLQSPLAHMPWYKIYNMDVWATVFTIISLLFVAILYFIVFCIRKCCRRLLKGNRRANKKKKN